MHLPTVSVIMPVHNCEKYINESIQSILHQTFSDFELIVIDDVSIDKTVDIVEGLKDPRIHLIKKEKNSGISDSLNLGMKIAKGKYIARMDGDDISVPERFEKQVKFLDAHPDVALCSSWYKLIHERYYVAEVPSEHEDIKIGLLSKNVISHPGAMLRKDFLMKHGFKYIKEMEPAEDYYLWTEMITKGKLHSIPEVLLHYRIHEKQVSTQRILEQIKKANECRINMLKHLIAQPTKEDKYVMENILFKTKSLNQRDLQRLLHFLNTLLIINAKTGFYKKDEFATYIEEEKRLAVRDCFIFRSKFNTKLLKAFLDIREAKKYLSNTELVKFFIKCLSFKVENEIAH